MVNDTHKKLINEAVMTINETSSTAFSTNSLNAKKSTIQYGKSEEQEKKKDSANLSSLMTSMSAAMTPDVKNTTPGTVRLEDIGEQIKIDKKAIDEEIESVMKSLGIDEDVSYSITTTSNGSLQVNGDFEGKEKFEEALNENEGFANRFRRLSALSSLQEAAKRSLEFQKEYEINPKAAVAKYAALFNDSTEYHFSYTYNNGQSATMVNVVTRGTYGG